MNETIFAFGNESVRLGCARLALATGVIVSETNGNGFVTEIDLEDTSNTNEITGDGTWDYTYDDDGNITGKTNTATGYYWTFTYDNRNELLQAKEYNASNTLEIEADFKYDVYGNRIEQDVTQSGVTTDQRYVLDGWNPAKSASPTANDNFDVLTDLNGSNDEVTRYLNGDNVDQLIGRLDLSGASDPAGTYWVSTDHEGSIRDVFNNSGVVKDSIQYDAFGNINTSTETDASYRGRYSYTGRELDVETGLQYNRARYYDSTTGRWISQDLLHLETFEGKRFIIKAVGPAKNQKEPIILIGHSLGGYSAIKTAGLLELANYKVDLQVTLDPVKLERGGLVGFPNGIFCQPNVQVAWNWYQTSTVPRGAKLLKFPGADTAITNVKDEVASQAVNNLQKGQILGHTDIDDEPTIAMKVKNEVAAIIKAWVPRDHRFSKLLP